jgi:protein ImuA
MLVAAMSSYPALRELRDQLACLEEAQRRFAHITPIADAVDCSMPHGGLPSGCIHEVKGVSFAGVLAFSSILSARIAGEQGNIVYIAPDRSLYPLGFLPYGISLDRLLFVSVRRTQDLAWAVLEALRCSQVSVVMAVLEGSDLTSSRRLQLAAESSGATGFLLGRSTTLSIAAPITRWKITPYAGKPGQRFDEPVWMVDLLYCRGGRPGSWIIEWRNRRLNASLRKQAAAQITREALAG